RQPNRLRARNLRLRDVCVCRRRVHPRTLPRTRARQGVDGVDHGVSGFAGAAAMEPRHARRARAIRAVRLQAGRDQQIAYHHGNRGPGDLFAFLNGRRRLFYITSVRDRSRRLTPVVGAARMRTTRLPAEATMDFKFSAEDEAFREEFSRWLKANLPSAGKSEDDGDFMRESSADDWRRRVEWHKKMHAGRWVGISWPKEYGGRGATLTQQIIYNEELAKVNSPMLVNGLGIMLVGPTIIHWGTEEQKKRHVPKILSADELWCQGYSEPGAGSDVAGLQTRAVEEGDYFIVNGQKVWTSDAHHADMCILLVRTDPDAPKHKGISYILVDMHSPGVTVRPLVQITGDANFNEVFF